ncbi:MAG TPA: TIGR02206 family membrane protein [Clostridia bacterium]|nr:TIGR02206 family membrane protein [Clostridia bacterium]
MGDWISFGPSNGYMVSYSAPHLVSLAVTALACIALVLCRRYFSSDSSKKSFRYIFAAFIALQQASIYIYYTVSGEWSLEVTLPLQLCDISLFLTIAVLLTKRQLLFELLYFWGIGGATQAILTPDIGPYTFPHFVFYQFFISHAVILLTCIYMISAEGFRPSKVSVPRTFLITNLYALLIYPVNILTKGNYLFLSRKPEGGTLLDLLGPWPWYLLSLEGVALLLFILLYLPFIPGGRKSRGTGVGTGTGAGLSA